MLAITSLAIYICLTGAAIVAFWIIGSLRFTGQIETPRYAVVTKNSEYEVREYEPYIVAKAEVPGPYASALNRGFRIIADYIFGNNMRAGYAIMQGNENDLQVGSQQSKGSEKIAMTAPVISEKAGLNVHGSYSISFVMPSKYSMDTLPVPRDARVKIDRVERRKAAAITFSGYATDKRVQEKCDKFRRMLERDGIRSSPKCKVAQYNPPWTFPLMRHNELIIDLQEEIGKN